MARTKTIRITKNDRTEYQRLVRNARAKISRTRKKYGVDLSQEVNLPKLEQFKTRSQFNKWKQHVSSFTNRHNMRYQFQKNKYGVVASKSELLEMETLRRRQIALAKREVEKIKDRPIFHKGEQISTVGERMLHFAKPSKVTGIRIPTPFNFDSVQSQRKLKEMKELAEYRLEKGGYEDRKELMKSNFKKAVIGSFNLEGIEIASLLDTLTGSEFYDLYISFEDVFNFEEYDSEGQIITATLGNLNRMKEVILEYKQGKSDIDYESFEPF